VSGGSRGIGRAVAKKLAEAGARVCVTYCSNKSEAENLVLELKRETAQAACYPCDVRKAEDARRLADQVLKEFGKIDILVNSAGIIRDNLLITMSDEEWDEVIQTNLNGLFYLCRAVVPEMLKQRWGRIINISSIAAEFGAVGQTNYAATKGAMNAFTKSLAQEIASKGVTVNAVAPGMVKTEMTSNVRNFLGDNLLKQIPIGRYAEPEEVASLVTYLALPEAEYITGQIMTIDGGISLNRRR
jgi:3-oxoacyl-[acyl-carrier protein] reductase